MAPEKNRGVKKVRGAVGACQGDADEGECGKVDHGAAAQETVHAVEQIRGIGRAH